MNDNQFRDIKIEDLLLTRRVSDDTLEVETTSHFGMKRNVKMSTLAATKYLEKVRTATFPDAIMIAQLILSEYSSFGITRENIKIGCEGVLVTDLFKSGDMTTFSTANSGDGFITVDIQSDVKPRSEQLRFIGFRSNMAFAQICFRIWLWKNAPPGPTKDEINISKQKIQDNSWVNITVENIDAYLNNYSSDLQTSDVRKMKMKHAILLFQGSVMFILVPGRSNVHLSVIDRWKGLLIEEKMFNNNTDMSKYVCEGQNMIDYIMGFCISDRYIKYGAHTNTGYKDAINKAFKINRKSSGKISDKKLLDYGIRSIKINSKINRSSVTKQHIVTNWDGRNANIKIELNVPTDGAIKSLICIERSPVLGKYIIYPLFNRTTNYAVRDVIPFDPCDKCKDQLRKLIEILNGG